jgi:hypothetical protein
MTVVNIRALTGEEIRFEFDNLMELELNPGPPNTPYRSFGEDSNFLTSKIDFFVTIPDSREVPKSIILKLTYIGNSAEQREAIIDCNGRVTKAALSGTVILHASAGRPRNGYKYRQKAEITLDFGNRCETLICPINGTTTFNMCFYDAYEAQNGKPGSIGSIYAY